MAARQANKNELQPDNHIRNLKCYLKISRIVMKQNTGYHCSLTFYSAENM